MFFHPQLMALFLIVGALIYWLIPSRHIQARRGWLIALSITALGVGAPQALLIVGGMIIGLTFWGMIFRTIQTWQTAQKFPSFLMAHSFLNIKCAAFSCAVLTVLSPMVLLDMKEIHNPVYTLGISYVTLKAISVVIDLYYTKEKISLSRIALLHLFLPIYSAGPIENLKTFSDEAFQKKFDWQDCFYGIQRILMGILKSYFLAAEILQPLSQQLYQAISQSPETWGITGILAYLLLNFLFIYVNFSGYTDIALGSARIFGIKVSENFNLPFLSTNIQEFWTRWHISLGRFINEYLYMRLTVLLRRPYLPLFIAFVLVGLWHQISVGYFLWGVGHGAALLIYLVYKRRMKNNSFYEAWHKFPPYRVFCWFFTMLYVSLLSYIANEESLDKAWGFLTGFL